MNEIKQNDFIEAKELLRIEINRLEHISSLTSMKKAVAIHDAIKCLENNEVPYVESDEDNEYWDRMEE